MKRLGSIIACLGVGLALTGLFWEGFWRGEGLIGGDLYTYFFPQKVYYAEHLKAGEFPLWNNLVGNGYPLVAESQTGAFYPPNYAAYQFWNVNTAYNLLQLAHYIIAFAFCVGLGRAFGFSALASALVGIVFVYGWFPARLSLEWAILTGAWMPAALWCEEKFLSTGCLKFALGLAIVLALQMLPGHFHLAFITQVLVLTYAVGRIWISRPDPQNPVDATDRPRVKSWRFGGVCLAMLLGFGLAAVQLVPTWELKTLSQRSAVGKRYEPGYGAIPPRYLTQIVAPFLWYGTRAELNAWLPPGSPPTNPVEAHLYFGLIPVALGLYGVFTGAFWRDRRLLFLAGLGILTMIYATGWLLPLTKYLPGFHYFRGVGRWGLITTLTVALLSGAALDAWRSRRRFQGFATVLALGMIALTVADLRIVRGLVGDAIFVEHPPVLQRDESPIRDELRKYPAPVRLFCRGANLPTLLGVASTPVYLGIGPDAYFDPQTKMPEPLPFEEPATPEQIDWLRRAGVTHVLSFSALDERAWPVELVWSGYDPFLGRAWARGPDEPFFLYELKGTRGRVAWREPALQAPAPEIQELTADRVVIRADSAWGGSLILTDLAYPGWEVAVDGKPFHWEPFEVAYRSVELSPGSHAIEWNFRPQSQRWGYWITAISCVLLMAIPLTIFLAKKPKEPNP